MKMSKGVIFVVRIDNKVLYDKSQARAYEVLINYSDGILPVNPFKIIACRDDIKICSYRKYIKELRKNEFYKDLSDKQFLNFLPSDEGFSIKYNGLYHIFFNESKPVKRIRWTIFHELGHYFLKHLDEGENEKRFFRDTDEYEKILEKEANCFARHCSSPLPVAFYFYFLKYGKRIPSLEFCKYFFDMSMNTTKICLNHFKKYYSHYIDEKKHEKLINKFKDSSKNLYAKLCVNRWNNYIELIKKL